MDKKAFRVEIREKTAALSEDYISESNRGIFRNFTGLPEYKSAGRLFIYFSVEREADTRAIIRRALSDGKKIAIPVSLPGGEMYFADVRDPASGLIQGRYGIPAPGPDEPPVRPSAGDILVVPALSFDRDGYRIGHGGGYYDRFMARNDLFSAGFCREKLLAPKVPRGEYDLPVKCLVTEAAVTRF